MSELDRLRRQERFMDAVLNDLSYEEAVKFERAMTELAAVIVRHGDLGYLALAVIGARQATLAAEQGLGEELTGEGNG